MKENRIQQRDSNFELLRIVAMVGIILYHLVRHHTDYNRFALINLETGASFQHLGIIQIFYTLGQLGNTLFILITGYFLIEKTEINVLRPGLKLLNRSYLLALILLAVAFLFDYFQLPYASNSDLHMALKGWWFVGYYLFIIVFAKFFLNKFLQGLDKQRYLQLILCGVILLSFMEVFDVFENLKLQNFAIGIVIYAIGGFIRRYNPFEKIRLLTLLLLIAAFVGIQLIQYQTKLDTNLQQFYLDYALDDTLLFVKSPFTNILWSPSILFLICSVTLFELFRRIKLGHNPFINGLSATTFSVYLFHESSFFKGLYFKGLPLPNRLDLLKETSTKILTEDPLNGTAVLLEDPQQWLNLKDFLNISQVFQERGNLVGVLYLLALTGAIFILGILCELVILAINKLFKTLFAKDYQGLKTGLK